MIPAPFEYHRAGSLNEVFELLLAHGDDAKLMAGGHSLLPLMKLRLAAPAVIVDISHLDELNFIREEGNEVKIGALTRHHTVQHSDLLNRLVPILPYATSKVGDPQVRHRGTIGGSIAHGDPASDLPAVALALGATFTLTGPSGSRQVPATEFFQGFLETALAPDEVLTEITVPRIPDAGWSFQKFNRRAQDWAIVGVAAVVGDGAQTGVALVNMAATPVRAPAVEEAIAGGASAAAAATHASDGLDPSGDLNASPDYRRHLAEVLTRRALLEAGAS